MPLEIERKFLVDLAKVPILSAGQRITQGYLPTQKKTTVRVRIVGSHAFLTIKGKTTGASRLEFEYPIPLEHALTMLDQLCDSTKIDKTRYEIPLGKHTWELDVFHGDNQGLVVAEVELVSELEKLQLPDWVTQEVTTDAKYYNINLLENPYSQWPQSVVS